MNTAVPFDVCEMAEKYIITTVEMTLCPERDLKLACGSGRGRAAVCVTGKEWQEGYPDPSGEL